MRRAPDPTCRKYLRELSKGFSFTLITVVHEGVSPSVQPRLNRLKGR